MFLGFFINFIILNSIQELFHSTKYPTGMIIRILAIHNNTEDLNNLNATILASFPDAALFTANNGPKGIALALAEDPDVVLLDTLKPDMDGFEVCRQFNRDEQLKDIPIVFLTSGESDRYSRIAALEAGAEGFLQKPVDEAELTAQIRAMVKVKSMNKVNRNDKERLTLMVNERTKELQKSHKETLDILDSLKVEIDIRTKTEDALRESEEKYRGIIEKSSNGILIADEVGNVIEWNNRLEQITGFKREDVIGKPIWDVQFRMLQEDFRTPEYYERTKQIASEILINTSSRYFGQTDNRKITRPDGSVRFLETIIYPIITANRTLIGSVSRDITEKKLADDAIWDINKGLVLLNEAAILFASGVTGDALFAAIVEQVKKLTSAISASVGIYDPEIQSVVVKHVQAEDYIMADFLNMVGANTIEEVVFKVHHDTYLKLARKPIHYYESLHEATFGVVPLDAGINMQNQFGIHRFLGISYFIDNELYGTTLLSFTSDTPYPQESLINSFASMVAIVLRRNKAESALRESENNYRVLVNEMQLGLATHKMIFDKKGHPVDYRFMDVNPSFERLTGLKRNDIVGKTVLEVMPETEKYWIEKYAEVVKSGNPLDYENYSSELDKFFRVIAYKTREEEFAVTIEDFTEKRKAENQISRINRIYTVISKVNQAIVHLRDKHELFREVCRIAVENGKFRMAWIGLVDAEGKTIKPAVFAGNNNGYLEWLKHINIAEGPEGSGPTGLAFRQGKHYVSNDIGNDPHMSPWKDEALRRGYLSSIAMPLKNKHITIGCFNLYSDSTNFFNEEEISLLKEIVDNIMFAIEAIDAEEERKQFEISLAKSEIHFRSISENSHTGIFIIQDDHYQYCNPSMARMFGYTHEEILASNPNDIVPVDQRDFVAGLINDHLQRNKRSFRFEIPGVKKDGTLIDLLILGGFAAYENEVVVIGNILEMTELKKTEASLRKAEKYFRHLIEKAPDGVSLISPSGEMIYASPSAKRIMGHGVTDNNLPNPNTSTHPDDLPRVIEAIQKTIMNPNEVVTIEYRFQTKTNDWKWIESTFTNQFHEEGIEAIVINFKDISERKLNEIKQEVIYNIAEAVNTTHNLDELIQFIRLELRKILDTTNFFVALYNESSDTITLPFYVDKKDAYSSFPAGKTMTGYLIKQKESIFVKHHEIETLVKEGVVETIGSTSKVWLGVPLKVNGLVTGAIVVQSYDDEHAYTLEDLDFLEFASSTISIAIDRKKGEEDLLVAMQQAMESDKLKSAFLTNMSHEIRTPMNAIMGFADLLPDSDTEEKDKYAEIIRKSSSQLLSLIDDIVYLSRLQSERMPLQNQGFMPAEMIRDLFEMFNHPQIKKNLTIIGTIPPDYEQIIINSDKSKIKQVLTNLTSNAIKYTYEGSVEIGFGIIANHVEFFVQDTGIGIPEKEMEHIFDSFFRGERVISEAIGGTGLGLNIAKELVELMGGQINVQSGVNLGSRFYFTIPLELSETSIWEVSIKPSIKKTWNHLNILIAEDEADNFMFLDIILADKVNRIDHALNGKIAIEMLAKERYDIVLMDLKMPVMGGIEATRKIKSQWPDIPVIAQTAYALPSEKNKAFEAGCDGYLAKPIKKEILFEIINSFVV
jgi:PAS domain S-box-containing protein